MNYLDMLTLLKQQGQPPTTEAIGVLANAAQDPLNQGLPAPNRPPAITPDELMPETTPLEDLAPGTGQMQNRQTGEITDIQGIAPPTNVDELLQREFDRLVRIAPHQAAFKRGALSQVVNAQESRRRQKESKQAEAERIKREGEQFERKLEQEKELQGLKNKGLTDKAGIEAQGEIDAEKAKLTGDGNSSLTTGAKTAAQKTIIEGKSALNNIDNGIKLIEKDPDAYQFMYGLLGDAITNRLDNQGIETRTAIDQITAEYRKWLTGAQMSDRERKAYQVFLPNSFDNGEIVKEKLKNMRSTIENKTSTVESMLSPQTTQGIVESYEEKTTTQEGQKAVSKSGKPIVYKDGQWHYE